MVSFPSWHCPVTPNHFNRKVICRILGRGPAMIYVGGHETTMLRPSAGYRHCGCLVLARSGLLLRGALLVDRVQQFEQGAVVQLKVRVPVIDDLVQLDGVGADGGCNCGLGVRAGRLAQV
jgi:hypothetical protein